MNRASSNAERSAAAYDARAGDYDRQLSHQEDDLRARDAFRALVRALVPSGCCILDFGCGTGADVQWYAQAGYRVLAYDVSTGMLHRLRQRCHAEIRGGRVAVLEGSYEDFLTRPRLPERPVAVTANFAVLNLIEELPPLFTLFARHMPPTGLLIASVLNPLFLSDVRYRWWWRGLPALLADGVSRLAGRETDIFRYTRRALVVAAGPRWKVVDWAPAVASRPVPGDARSLAWRRSGWFTRYHFVVFRLIT